MGPWMAAAQTRMWTPPKSRRMRSTAALSRGSRARTREATQADRRCREALALVRRNIGARDASGRVPGAHLGGATLRVFHMGVGHHHHRVIGPGNRAVAMGSFFRRHAGQSFRRAAEIGSEYLCIQHGDTLGYSLPGDPSMGARSITVHGAQAQMQCTIDSVTPGPP